MSSFLLKISSRPSLGPNASDNWKRVKLVAQADIVMQFYQENKRCVARHVSMRIRASRSYRRSVLISVNKNSPALIAHYIDFNYLGVSRLRWSVKATRVSRLFYCPLLLPSLPFFFIFPALNVTFPTAVRRRIIVDQSRQSRVYTLGNRRKCDCAIIVERTK